MPSLSPNMDGVSSSPGLRATGRREGTRSEGKRCAFLGTPGSGCGRLPFGTPSASLTHAVHSACSPSRVAKCCDWCCEPREKTQPLSQGLKRVLGNSDTEIKVRDEGRRAAQVHERCMQPKRGAGAVAETGSGGRRPLDTRSRTGGCGASTTAGPGAV